MLKQSCDSTIRPLQVLVWFLVHHLHQISDFLILAIIGSAHAQKNKLSMLCAQITSCLRNCYRWVVSSAHFVPQAIVKLLFVVIYLFLGSFSLGQSSVVATRVHGRRAAVNARPLSNRGKCHLRYHFFGVSELYIQCTKVGTGVVAAAEQRSLTT